MSIITTTQFNRPEYTYQMLRYLSRCRGIEKYTLVASIEPDNQEVIKLVRDVKFMPRLVRVNERRLGCNQNTYSSLKLGFEFSDNVFHVEDDVILAADALEIYERWLAMPNRNFTICMWNRLLESSPDQQEIRHDRFYFRAYGFGLTKDGFKKTVEHDCYSSDINPYLSWDIRISNMMAKEKLFGSYPNVSRANNIGATKGEHVPSPEWHTDNHRLSHWIEGGVMNNITLCCVAHNEESRITNFIKYHAPYFNEIIIVDSDSSDKTVELAQAQNVIVIHDKCRGLAEPSRHLAALRASNQWLLFLDADEFASQELLDSLPSYLRASFDGYILERHNYVDDSLISSEKTQYRLFKKTNAVFNWFLHGGIEPAQCSKVGTIDNAILHKKSTAEHNIDHDTYKYTILHSPESVSPFWYAAYQAEAFPIECMLTMVVTTSAKHTNPDVSNIRRVFTDYGKMFNLQAVRKILVVDGFDERRNVNNLTYMEKLGPLSKELFDEYKHNLRNLCPSLGVEMLELPENMYMDRAILEATTRIGTPYYFFTPDDILPLREVDIPSIVKQVAKDISVKRLYFNEYPIASDPTFHWHLEDGNNPDLPYVKTTNWSQNTHIGYTHHYNYCHSPKIRQFGRTTIEIDTRKEYNELARKIGFDAAFRIYGTCLYGHVGDAAYTQHDFSYLEQQ